MIYPIKEIQTYVRLDYKQEVNLLRLNRMTHVDVDHYMERGIRCKSEHMTIDEYEALQEDHYNGLHHCDAYTEIINVQDIENCESTNAIDWFRQANELEIGHKSGQLRKSLPGLPRRPDWAVDPIV